MGNPSRHPQAKSGESSSPWELLIALWVGDWLVGGAFCSDPAHDANIKSARYCGNLLNNTLIDGLTSLSFDRYELLRVAALRCGSYPIQTEGSIGLENGCSGGFWGESDAVSIA